MQVPAGNPVLKVRERKTRAVGLPPDLMSVRDIADTLGVCMDTVRRKIKAGQLPEYWFGGARRVSLADVVALMGCRTRPKPVPPKNPNGRAGKSRAVASKQ